MRIFLTAPSSLSASDSKETIVQVILAFVLTFFILGSIGCGTSQVFADDPTARIWANGRMIGKGHGEIQQRGMPETTSILVRAEDGREQVTTVKRSITGITVLGAFLTYGTCLIFCWEYPDAIWASLPQRAPPYGAPGGFPGGGDPWMTPPPGWQPKTNAVPAATPDTTLPQGPWPAAPPAPPAPPAEGPGAVQADPGSVPATSARPSVPLRW
jgi:hypothetical protein